MLKLYTLLIFITCFTSLKAQDFSNSGKDFWLGYGSHCQMYSGGGGGSQEMVIYISTEQATSVKVEIPILGYSQTYNIPANTVFTTPAIPKTGAQDARLTTEGISDKGIHITSTKNVVAYAHIYNGSISGATLLFPANVLGKEYYSINFTQNTNQSSSYPYFFAVATDTGITTIEVTPTANTQNMVAGTTYTYNLTQGQIFNALGQITQTNGVDLTGSKIKSISTSTTGCKKIAVFSGSGKINICNNGGSADNYIQQAFPREAWGTKFLTVPTLQMPFNYYRICVSDPNAIVKRNGVVLTGLINNFYYQVGVVSDLGLIESDKPITVAQYITTRGSCGNTNFGPASGYYGDPEVIYLSPVEQNISKVILNSTPNSGIVQHYINAVIKTTAVSSFKIDGVSYSSAFLPHPQDPAFSYIQQSVGQGQHIVQADSGFNAIAYGYGSAESYGYNAGTNVKDLYQYATVTNTLGDTSITFAAACKNSPFSLYQRLPYKPLSITWDFTNSGLPFANYTNNNPGTILYDSTFVNTKWVYRYKNPNSYIISNPGTYPISIVVNNPTSDGCSGIQEIDFNLEVFDNPIANFDWTHTGCATDTVYFRENASATQLGNRPVYKWRWLYHDNTTDSVKNPKKLYNAGGSFPVKLQLITDVGCLSDTLTKVIDISSLPVANFTLPTPTCVGSTLSFTSNSTIATGTIEKYAWNWGDGSPADTLLIPGPATHTYTTAGTYNITHTVIALGGCRSLPRIIPITINAKPVANFNMPANVCLPLGATTFTNTTTITDGTLPQVTYVWNFGDASPTTTTTNGIHNYTAVGPFNVNLQATSNNGCIHDTTKVFNNIRPRPTANFANANEICIKDSLQFTSTSVGNGGNIITYNWDFGDATTSSLANPKKKWATNGSKIVKHWIVTDQGCSSDTMTKTIYVNASPIADFNFSNLGRCAGTPIIFNDASTFTDGVITNWRWDFGDGTPIVNATSGVSQSHPFTTSGTYQVKLVVTTDKGCVSDTIIKPIIITASPLASFVLPGGICLPSGFAQFTNNTIISDGTLPTVTYVWDFGDATPTSTVTNPTHNYSGVGPYNVKLTATSAIGCVDDSLQVLSNIFARPTANFTTNAEVCLNSNITFTSTSSPISGTISEYYWDNGNGSFILGAATSTTSFATSGNKTIRHYIKTSNGCISDTISKIIYVNALPTPNFTFSNPQCVDKNITFTNSSTTSDGIINSWSWDFGDGSAVVTGVGPHTHIYNSTNSFNVSLSVSTDKGCSNSAPIIKPVVVNPNPLVKMYLPEICLNDPTAQFLDSSTIADGTESQFTYLWNFGDPNATIVNPNTSTIKNATHQYIQAANYNMWLEVTSNNGCTTRKDTVFTVNGATPVANFTVQNAGNLCSNTDVTIQNTSTVNFGTVTYLEIYWDWTNNPLLKTIDQNPTPGKLYNYAYTPFGTPATRTYTVRMVAYSGSITGPCLNVVTRTITVLASPNIVFSNIPEICQENAPASIIQAQETTGIAGVGVFTGPGIVGNLFNPSIAGIGTHTIRYTFTGTNGCTTYKEQTITVNPTPIANAGPDVTVLEGGNVTLQGSSTSSNVTYLWTPNTSLSSTSILQPSASPANDITYTLRVTSDKGCNATDQVLVRVLKGPRVPNAFSPNGDGINDKWEIEFLDTYLGCTVEVFNIYGQKVYRSVGYGTPWDGKFNGVTLPIGTYYYIIEPKNNRSPITGYVGIIK